MGMNETVHNVAEIDSADRRALEHLIGKSLSDQQQVVITVVEQPSANVASASNPIADGIPDWWKIYEGLSDEEVDRLDQAIRQRANLTRVFE
jgi:hypothetical protein